MILNGLFDPLWFNADVTLRGGGTAVLQKPLNKGRRHSRRPCIPFSPPTYKNHTVFLSFRRGSGIFRLKAAKKNDIL
jgi:hypothetical protein